MIWGDMVQKDENILKKLGKDINICYWMYDFKKIPKIYKNLSNNFYICPGTNTWKSFFPRYDFAIKNFQLMKERADIISAKGFMITDWGDAGHIHPSSFTENLFDLAYKVFNGDQRTELSANKQLDKVIRLLDEIHFGDYLNAENVKDYPEYVTKHLFHEYVFRGKGFASQTKEQLNKIISKIKKLRLISKTMEYSTEFEQDIKMFVD